LRIPPISINDFKRILRSWPLLLSFAHNLHPATLERLSDYLWSDPTFPTLMIVRSAGFLAEFFIQFHEHHGKLFC
jgi:hypothetical protein